MKNLFDDIPKSKPSTATKAKDFIALGLLSFISFSMFVTLWSIFAPAKLSYNSLPWEIPGETRSFKPGEIVPLKVYRCNTTKEDIIYLVTRGIRNVNTGITTVLQSTTVAAPPGCTTSISQLHSLPLSIEPGVYVITGIGTIPDVLNTKNISFESEPFTVVK